MDKMASIDLGAMSSLIGAMSDAASNLPYDRYGLTSALGAVDVDASPSQKLSTVANWVDQQIPGLRRRLALAQAAEASKPSFQSVVQIHESDVSTTDPATAQNLGASDAKKLKDSNGAVDPALIAEIVNNQNDPYFAAGLAQNITPVELAQVVTDESRLVSLIDDGSGVDYRAEMDDWKKNYGDLLSAVGTTLAAATCNTGALALPSDYGKQWTDAITADVPSQGGDGAHGQGAALSLLLAHGSFSTAFLGTVSSGVYDYERKNAGDGPLWRPRSWEDTNFAGVDSPDGAQISDPLAGIMTALSHNPDAAQNFFDVGNPNASTVTMQINGKDVPANARLKYLIEDRTWATGDTGSDNGSGLGGALQAASTFYRADDPQGQVSATIAAQTFALIGTYTGHGYNGNWRVFGGHDGWKMWDGMRTNVANMIAGYSPDLIRVAGVNRPASTGWNGTWVVSDAGNSLFPPNGPASAWLDPKLMSNIIKTLGESPANMDVVNTGIAAAGRLVLAYAAQRGLQTDPNAAAHVIAGTGTVPALTGASGALAYALNFAISAGHQGDKDKEELEKERAEEVSKILGIVTSVPGLALPEGHEWSQFLIDQVKDQALDKIGEGPDQDAQGTYNDIASDYQSRLQQLTLNTLLDGGYLSAENYAKANPATAPNEFVSPLDPKYAGQHPPAVTADASGHLQFNFDSQAYHDWEQDGQALNSWVQTNVTGPFRDNLPAYGG